MTCEPNPSVVSFLPGLALMKTTVLKSMRTLSYFRLDTLTLVSSLRNILSLFVLLYNCLCSAGVGKSELVLRFVDSNFSGMPVLGCVKCQASCSR